MMPRSWGGWSRAYSAVPFEVRNCGQTAAGLPSTFPPPDTGPHGTGGNRRRRQVTVEAVGRPFVHVTSDYRDHVGMWRDPRGDGGATCKIAGIAYTGSNPVPATQSLTSNSTVLGRPIKSGSGAGFPSTFPPPDALPTPPAHRVLLGRRRPRSPRPAGARSGELVDVHALGEGASVGMAQLGGDNTGRFLVGRHG